MEYDNLKKTLICMLKSNYPYISFAYGGFNAIHELSFKYKISLLNHDPNCDLCKKIKKNSNFFIKKIKALFKNNTTKEIIESSNNDSNNINDSKNQESKNDDNIKKGERFHISLFNKMIEESNYNANACLLIENHMKLYNIFAIFLLCGAAFFMASCNDMLETYPYGQFTDEQMDENAVDGLMAAAYAGLEAHFIGNNEAFSGPSTNWVFDVRSDDALKGGSGTSMENNIHLLEISSISR